MRSVCDNNSIYGKPVAYNIQFLPYYVTDEPRCVIIFISLLSMNKQLLNITFNNKYLILINYLTKKHSPLSKNS